MKASPQLDRLISQHVFNNNPELIPFPFSTDIRDAWKVVEEMADFQSIGAKMVGEMPAGSRFYYLFERSRLWSMSAPEAAHKICELALQALNVIVPDKPAA
jgi:hypothetical protein